MEQRSLEAGAVAAHPGEMVLGMKPNSSLLRKERHSQQKEQWVKRS